MSPPNPPPTGYPKHFYILNTHWIKSQHKKNWCGPTAMQSIAWNYHGSKQTQHTWSNRLGTTSAGTSIWRIVKAVNRYTGYDKSYHAGKYITLDISGYGYGRWYRLNKRHYWKYTAPVVLHPKLGKKWYYYLDRNEGGHFQVGRGYRTRSGKVNQVSYFEPWNPHYFNQGRPYIGRVHRLSAKKQYYANEANQFQNIGV